MKVRDPQRLVLAAYPVTRTLTTRVGDLDGYGHLNAMRIGTYYEDARAAFYGVAFKDVRRQRMLVAQVTLHYLGEGFWPGSMEIGTGISKIGNASVEMAQGLFFEGRCIGLCETVLVNAPEGRSAPFADDARACLARFALVPDPSVPG
ncbi:thioesterase family protein [uncultured Phenylobacterium sp.]|uniref:acyl-CoA thioesterase n=1 Tax=uncultured Phenylobacterium sp. TaxID=349273 RepID=UPI0025DF7667|nr:thioesterase family protein [uncultured Phenylobacterium sp.]